MDIEIIPCLNDNYSYLIKDTQTDKVAIIDPSEFGPCDKKINQKYKPNFTRVNDAIEVYQKNQNEKNLYNLFKISEGNRGVLFRRMNMAPNGTSIIVDLREDLLRILKDNSELKGLDDDLRFLFRDWFNPGFLKLEKITWDTKAAVLEKIIQYERVHHIKDMNELKRRLGEDRRFFSYFHPALED